MKKIALIVSFAFFCFQSFAQVDKVYKHSGEKLEVKVMKVGEFTISYVFPNETAEQILSKYAVSKIEYSSGRSEKITDKIVVAGEDDWESVVVLEDKSAATGLKKGEEIRGKTAGIYSFHTAGSADKKSMMKLKKEAAKAGAPFVLITSDKDNQFTAQSIKKGVFYSYK